MVLASFVINSLSLAEDGVNRAIATIQHPLANTTPSHHDAPAAGPLPVVLRTSSSAAAAAAAAES